MLAAAIAGWLPAGCGSDANEEGFDKGGKGQVARPEGMPNFRTQGEYELWKTEQASKTKSLPAAKNRTRPGPKAGRH